MKAAYYDETKRFAWLFGIPDAVLPPTWEAFRTYVDATIASPTIAVGTLARTMGQFLLDPARTRLPPMFWWNGIMTAGLLPERVRDAYGLSFGTRERTIFDASIRGLGATWRYLPETLRFQPAYLDAQRRLAGGTTPHPMVGLMEWVLRVTLR